MPFAEISPGVKLWYEDVGEGAPLVLVHGWGMSRTVWHCQQGLTADYRVITIDLRGHGRSSTPPSGFGLEEFAADLISLFGLLQLDNATLIGWSMGALVALKAFVSLKERLTALVLVSGTSKFTAGEDYPFGLPAVMAKGLALRLTRDYANALADFFKGMFVEGEFSPTEFRHIWEEVANNNGLPRQEAARESLTALAAADLRDVLPAVDLPVLLIHGSADAICLSSASRFMAEHLPNAQLEIIEGVGHAPFLSRPLDFACMLKKFLDGIHAQH